MKLLLSSQLTFLNNNPKLRRLEIIQQTLKVMKRFILGLNQIKKNRLMNNKDPAKCHTVILESPHLVAQGVVETRKVG